MSKPTFYTAFSNSITDVIPNLSEEAMKISDLLQELAFNDKLYYIKDEVFSFDRLLLNFGKYGRRIDIFYFSGHGVDGCLQLFRNFTIQPAEMSDIVNTSLKNAKLIFFNACETFKLAQHIIDERQISKDNLVIISCKNKINSFIAERFATLLFTQIGQPGTYREAYDQAKSLMKAIHKDLRFKEFDCRKDVTDAADDFDIGYIEIKAEKRIEEEEDCTPVITASVTGKKAKTSIIGKDKLTRDALTSNYVHEVVESIAANPQTIQTGSLEILKNALVSAEQVAKGEKKNKQMAELFKKAAELLPGFSSPSAFDSLINAEKNIDNPSVKSLIKSKLSGNTIGGLIEKLTSIKL
ncbi:hypothetical protein [Niastella populi]|uniref:CHAT domain-containing protein n=1 Tax=Niastella populi TaxID=550983 RepID=A0A1V9FKZ6_9BACT|nr:hypothetical protein [Niastella populi]OQP59012.1 hypothetical protein A4R26_21725 [Niastella populi]